MSCRSLAAFLLLILVTLGVGCDQNTGGGGAGGSAGDTIKIGHVASKTGDTATFGVSADEGIRLAMDEINAKGGILGGKKVEVITEDDRSLADEAKTVANKLITRDKVVAIIGEIASPRSIAIAPICEDNKVPMLSPGSTNPKVTEGFDYVFRNCFIDPFQGTVMANFGMKPPPAPPLWSQPKPTSAVNTSPIAARNLQDMGRLPLCV